MGEDYETYTEPQRFDKHTDEIYSDFDLYLKRVRSQSKATLRYIMVFEKHQNGLPHMHVMVHEVLGVVLKKVLKHQWGLGLTTIRLSRGKHEASYLTKYLAKGPQGRVRHSRYYGSGHTVLTKVDHSDAMRHVHEFVAQQRNKTLTPKPLSTETSGVLETDPMDAAADAERGGNNIGSPGSRPGFQRPKSRNATNDNKPLHKAANDNKPNLDVVSAKLKAASE